MVKKIEKAHGKGIMDLSWLNNEIVATCSTDNTVKLWNVQDGSEMKSLGFGSEEKLDLQ